MPYLTNQEGLNHEANFYGFYTQEGVQDNWNLPKIFTEKEVMNFTIQRFLSPSICEYANLEENSSPKKKRPEQKPIIGVKRSLLAFQKAQDLEKWSRKLENMINFPKPAKPALHLPYLEDSGFTSNQPQEWQPGDLLSHSEALYNIIGSTLPHWIRRIPIKPKDQAGLHQLAKPTSFKESLQPIQFGSTQGYLWEPGDTIDHSEDIQDVLSWTSTQEIRRISLPINLPYLATSTLNALEEFLQSFAQDQRPYSLLLRPRSISGRLEDHGHVQKLSRYKSSQVSLLEGSKSSLTAIFHGVIKAFAPKTLTPKHLELSRLLSIESCGVLNPPSFHSNSFITCIPSYRPSDHLFGRPIQASIIHLAHPESQSATFEARKIVEQEVQRVLPKEANFQPNQGHAIVHCLEQESDIPKVRKMSTSVGQNTLIRSKDKPEQVVVQVKAKVSPIHDKSFHKSSTTCMMHLSLSKSVITGLKEPRYIEEEAQGTNLPMDQKEAQSTKQSKLLNKPKPVIQVSNQGKCLTPPLDTGLNIYILGTGIPDESHMITGVPSAELDHELNQNPHHKWKPKFEQCTVQVPKSEESKVTTRQTKNKKFLLPHLTLRCFDPGISQEEHKNRAELPQEDGYTNQGKQLQERQPSNQICPKKNIILHHADAPKNVEKFSGCKEESFKEIPPDNLLLLGGSNPKMVRTEPARKVGPTPYSTSQGANQDIRALKMPYLTNQEGLNHEDNFYGFYTQEGIQDNWNLPKIFTEKEVMNFTIQRFLSPSICEYANLEEDSSPKKKRPEPKPIIGVKRSLLAFQKAQDLEKWSRKLEDMINFPKPAKPALHLPYLEDPGFTSNQPQEWQPGDLLSHSEALYNIIGSTMPHWIRRIPIKPKDQAGLHQLAKPTSFKESLQPIQFGSTQGYLWEPGDTLDHSEDIQDVLSWTSTQEIRRISLPINLPYLATSTLNALEEFLQSFAQDQRPYSLLLRPRSISGRLEDHGHVQKLSRYKSSQVSLLEGSKSSLTAIFHGVIKAFAPKTLTPKHLDLSRLLSIESCGVLNPPSFHSNSFITCIPSYRPSDHLFGRPIQASIIHLAHPESQPATLPLREPENMHDELHYQRKRTSEETNREALT
ncbi:hypothetical protein IGI04_029304 [Brassica rapa subsp. trilocularis]|uniref:Uncharacterized protein n=1 Tax=Brassica rapa subsp. trilocularis TaxID=1813537 RepID=A0ABQ7LQD2_BRACM|nr:hypothetical protein IGI04_029304 [Brassica rapa subsp. trilocularis]